MTNILEPITVLIRNSTVHQWYVSKNEGDKRILKLLAGLSLSLICYVGLWMPLNNYVDTQQRQAVSRPVDCGLVGSESNGTGGRRNFR